MALWHLEYVVRKFGLPRILSYIRRPAVITIYFKWLLIQRFHNTKTYTVGTHGCLIFIQGVQEKRAHPGSGTVRCVWSMAILLVSISRNSGSTSLPYWDYVVSNWGSRIKWKKCSGEAIAWETGYLYIHAFFSVSGGSRKSNGPGNSRGGSKVDCNGAGLRYLQLGDHI